MKLMDDEKKIFEQDKFGITLTSHRVRFDAKEIGKRKIISIMLDELTSCTLSYKSHFMLIVLAVLSIIIGYADSDQPGSLVVGIVFSIILTAAYFITRKNIFSLSSPTASIDIEAKGIKSEEIEDFIDSVEKAKAKYRS